MPKPRGGWSALPLLLLSVGLMLLPADWTRPARLTLQSTLIPVRAAAHWIGGGSARALSPFDRLPPSDELLRVVEFEQSKAKEYQAKILQQQATIDSLSAARKALKDPKPVLLPAAVVLPSDSTPWRKSMVVAAGSRQGVRAGLPVLWHNHFVGRVAEVGPFASRVTLLTDPEMKVGAAAAAHGRDVGILEGTGEPCASLKWVAPDVAAEDGATVVTTPDPFRGIPEGLLLGRVRGVNRSRAPLPRVQVEPFYALRALETVLIMIPGGE